MRLMIGIIIHIVIAVTVACAAVGLTTVYWRRLYGRLKLASHLQQVREQVNSRKQAKVMQSKLDFLQAVLGEVQYQHDGMTSYLKLLTSDDINPSQTEWKVASDHMKKRASVLTEMVNGSLEVMHYEDLTDIGKDDQVQVNSFCQDAFSDCTPYLSGNVELRLETGLDHNHTIRTNIKALQTVLTNLIRCSMHFTHEGEIVLKVKRRRQKSRNHLMFTLADTGLGIPDNAKDRIFEYLPPHDAMMKLIVVRLRLCRALVRLLGGTIYVDSTRERGTAVVFTIKE